MLLDADILGEKRRLVEWLFEPLYALRARLAES
jgi:membrane fusion protein